MVPRPTSGLYPEKETQEPEKETQEVTLEPRRRPGEVTLDPEGDPGPPSREGDPGSHPSREGDPGSHRAEKDPGSHPRARKPPVPWPTGAEKETQEVPPEPEKEPQEVTLEPRRSPGIPRAEKETQEVTRAREGDPGSPRAEKETQGPPRARPGKHPEPRRRPRKSPRAEKGAPGSHPRPREGAQEVPEPRRGGPGSPLSREPQEAPQSPREGPGSPKAEKGAQEVTLDPEKGRPRNHPRPREGGPGSPQSLRRAQEAPEPEKGKPGSPRTTTFKDQGFPFPGDFRSSKRPRKPQESTLAREGDPEVPRPGTLHKLEVQKINEDLASDDSQEPNLEASPLLDQEPEREIQEINWKYSLNRSMDELAMSIQLAGLVSGIEVEAARIRSTEVALASASHDPRQASQEAVAAAAPEDSFSD
ncbi:serine/arginine repetitive matrix protein 1-like [Penaeus vannamei]|uniref:serine/arginine repetitive matrix protein 1-like n=1 Tax=Penaeus vannamei TaxID=6689 RepID=UPI00387F8570